LNLFSFKPNAFDAESETTGVVLAAHAAAAILASRQGEQLESALSTRDRIGQAKGIIMERFGVDDVRAFEMLRKLSQDSNIRLIDVAQRVIDTRGEN
jgi:AmiR/NasT family two-component response regulator